MRIMGLDVGEKRIGIAISDPLGWTAQGHSVLIRKGLNLDLLRLAQICSEYGIERIVLGLPLNMNGPLGPKAAEVKELGQILEQEIGLPIDYWDERLSTVSAQRVLLEGDVSRRKRKQHIDKLAAVYILQAYLDRLGHK